MTCITCKRSAAHLQNKTTSLFNLPREIITDEPPNSNAIRPWNSAFQKHSNCPPMEQLDPLVPSLFRRVASRNTQTLQLAKRWAVRKISRSRSVLDVAICNSNRHSMKNNMSIENKCEGNVHVPSTSACCIDRPC